MKHAIGLLLVLLLNASCVDQPDWDREQEGEPGTSEVGSPCSKDEDCLGGLICVTQLPGGSCTRQCAPEEYDMCPGDSLCVTIRILGKKDFACASLCADSYHPEYPPGCRDGYRCVSVGTQSVCGI